MDYRVILYHKQSTSARTRFLRYAYDSVCAFDAIPMPAQIVEDEGCKTVIHPAAILRRMERHLDFPADCLKAQGEYHLVVEASCGKLQIILARITTEDPPFEQAAKSKTRFIDLTQARDLPPVELELLRHAYELILGG